MPDGVNPHEEAESIIDNLYEASIINQVAKEPTRKSIHVSDLTSDCMRKAWYRLNDFAKDMKDFKKSLPLFHGTALHEFCDLKGIEHELSMYCDIKQMTVVSDKFKLTDCVKGSMDDLVEIDDELIIVDKKTTKKSIPRIAKDTHMAQMNIYKLLYFITSGVEIERAAIIYIDKSSAWERHQTRMFNLLPIEEIRTGVLAKLQVLDTDSPPDRVVTFLCPWCDYHTECNPSGY